MAWLSLLEVAVMHPVREEWPSNAACHPLDFTVLDFRSSSFICVRRSNLLMTAHLAFWYKPHSQVVQLLAFEERHLSQNM